MKPSSIVDIRSFHGLAPFYQRFVKSFNSIVAPLIECLKRESEFRWSKNAQKSSKLIKEKLCTVPIITLLDFAKMFEIKCDASGVGMRLCYCKK